MSILILSQIRRFLIDLVNYVDLIDFTDFVNLLDFLNFLNFANFVDLLILSIFVDSVNFAENIQIKIVPRKICQKTFPQFFEVSNSLAELVKVERN